MQNKISYTAAYAEMARHILQGLEALQRREATTAIRCFAHAAQLSDDANLGPEAVVGSRRNLAIAYRSAGQLADAERVLRELLAYPELGEEERAFVMHDLGSTLALAGAPEAADILAGALRGYTAREDRILCALDLAELWFSKGDLEPAYHLLAGMLRPEDAKEQPDRFCQAQLLLTRLALARREMAEANSHLESARASLAGVTIPILHALYLATLAEREYREGNSTAAQSHCVTALELALAAAELDTGEALRTIATVFLKVFNTSPK